MRKLLTAFVCLLAAPALAGCSGADAQRAEALLQQAQAAQANVSSTGFIVRMNVDSQDQAVTVAMQGGGYMKGPRAGDFYMTATGTTPLGSSPLDFGIVKRGGLVTVRAQGQTRTMSLPAAQSQLGSGIADMSSFLDLAKYVKSVSVSEVDFNGRPTDKIVGTLNTQSFLNGLGGVGASALGDSGVHFGDVRAVLFLPRDTHLVEVMLADMTVHGRGRSARMQMSVALTGVNQPVTFPGL